MTEMTCQSEGGKIEDIVKGARLLLEIISKIFKCFEPAPYFKLPLIKVVSDSFLRPSLCYVVNFPAIQTLSRHLCRHHILASLASAL